MNLDIVVYALLGGLLPALLWLCFWLLEDRRHPEPNRLLLRTFLFGMLSVALVIPLQKGVESMFPALIGIQVILWAVIEEVFKFMAGYFGGIHTVEDNEPVDPLVYMVTAALGFVAVENTLFILGPLLGNDTFQSIVTGNLRFIGASLLHVVSSGLVGAMISFSFYRSRERKKQMLAWGLAGAVGFHAAFNLLILVGGPQGMMAAFVLVWIAVGMLLWAFEKAKWIAP
jgi:RsiW-degrading membrane proteinase PrsW (M82 family)